jgi:hypothetical protein
MTVCDRAVSVVLNEIHLTLHVTHEQASRTPYNDLVKLNATSGNADSDHMLFYDRKNIVIERGKFLNNFDYIINIAWPTPNEIGLP